MGVQGMAEIGVIWKATMTVSLIYIRHASRCVSIVTCFMTTSCNRYSYSLKDKGIEVEKGDVTS